MGIKSLPAPDKGEKIYPDATLAGFGVRVCVGGTKSFVLTHGKLRRRETVGRVGILGLQEARAEAKRRLAEYTLGKTVAPSVRWREAVERFLKEGDKRLKRRTLNDYERLLNRHFRFGELKLNEITPSEIQRRIDKLADTPVEQHHAFVVLRTFMTWAHRKHFVERHPMERMVSGFRYRPRARILTDEELRKVWNAVGDDTFGTVVKVLILTGQRVGEVSKLSRDMIGNRTITLPSWLTKNGREHTFPVGPMVKELLNTLPMEKSGQYCATPVTYYVRHKLRLDKDSGVSDWTLHDLRRTFASGCASIGVQLPVIERFLNHVSGSFAGIVGVYQRYDFMPEMRDAIEKWELHVHELTDDD